MVAFSRGGLFPTGSIYYAGILLSSMPLTFYGKITPAQSTQVFCKTLQAMRQNPKKYRSTIHTIAGGG
jgi:hypothetical protein